MCFVLCAYFLRKRLVRRINNDLKDTAERAKKHENSVSHMNACVDVGALGKAAVLERE